ncbi:TPA: phospholipase D family protein [Burkholderia territorii]|uniref:phospholipase D family protein n=1 Tax=Burkholderia territorii TaxID=1503055 RepID=UPI0011CB75C7|nr:phospholipase D family protein [Burkholderia territorii]TXG15789.1 phospholipase D family protein [Burkholderia territorii]HDR8860595.1 phospholipase D family protein [Burkholderia territorii]HDR8864174.1 phospholipase D family protein [Burkholderia territorii]HDR8870426.1 phospholipase D family protein [Burkholderia territorii]HDR8876928.1 phospholipase D family protein [Burkholderia territorii]
MLTSLIRRAPAALSWRVACRAARALAVCALLSSVAACATHPPATTLDRSVSHALPADTATPLRNALAAPQAAHPGQSGFRLLSDGATALQMRIALARAATKTLDMQYYIATEDTTGKLLLAAALYAADRGVRVRMLVDDLNFRDIDRVMAALNTHPKIEIRVFNPFGASHYGMVERTANSLTRIDSFTRRMHNKAMIADNQIAIVGGRNLGDEYFSASPTLQFRDLDVLAAGPVTNDISRSFDDYWASASSYPLRVLNHQTFDPKDLDAMRDELRDHWRKNADPYNAKPLNATPLAQQIARDELELVWAPAEFKVDAPDKIVRPTDTYVSPPMQRLVELMRGAQQEFLAFSPYFVPHDAGVKILGDTAARGVRVAILTNSLAATDAVAVQAGYAPYRVPLLRRGVELYEFKARPNPPSAGLFGSRSRASLHAKAYVIDRKVLVIGSLNLDPRSAHLNTELALVIHSPTIAQQAAAIFARVTQPDESYRVSLATPAGGGPAELKWTGTDDGAPATYHVDPHAGLMRNLMTGFFMLLPVDEQL